MADYASVTMYPTVDVVETGLWCDTCHLPSLCRVEIRYLCEYENGSIDVGSEPLEAHSCTNCQTLLG